MASFQVIDDFPSCTDLRPQWWRLWSYQLVHAGSQHISFNMVMQILFGLPINVRHEHNGGCVLCVRVCVFNDVFVCAFTELPSRLEYIY
jgi:rhomboid-related protein 1/2/3